MCVCMARACASHAQVLEEVEAQLRPSDQGAAAKALVHKLGAEAALERAKEGVAEKERALRACALECEPEPHTRGEAPRRAFSAPRAAHIAASGA